MASLAGLWSETPATLGTETKVNIILQILAPDDDEAVHFWVILCQIKGFNKWQKISVMVKQIMDNR